MTEQEQKFLYESVGNQIKILRKKAGVSQEGFAKKLGLSRVSIVNMEKGRQHPSLHLLIDIARILKIPLTDFLTDESWKNPDGARKLNSIKKTVKQKMESSSSTMEPSKVLAFLDKINL